MNVYKFNTRVSRRGTITLPCNLDLHDKEVRLIILPLNRQKAEMETQDASDFLKKWSGAFKGLENITDEELDNMKYEYLKEKYK